MAKTEVLKDVSSLDVKKEREKTQKEILDLVSKKLEDNLVPPSSFAPKPQRQVQVQGDGRVIMGSSRRPQQSQFASRKVGAKSGKSKKGKKGGKKGKKSNGGRRGYAGPRPNTLATFRTVIPDAVTVEMPFMYQGIIANAGLAYASARFITNGIYDPDPTIGGNSFLGLYEWGQLYNYFRPLQVFYEVTLINQEAFPMSVYLYNLNTDPGGTVGTAGGYYAEQQFGKRSMVGPLTAGNSKHTFRGRVSFSALLGEKGDLMADDNYRGICASANPSDGFYLGFNSEANVVQTALGMLYTIVLKVVCTFYDRKALVG